MSRRNIYELVATCVVLVLLFLSLLRILHIGWPGVAWASVAVLAAIGIGFMAPVVYALVSMEMGYYTEAEISRRISRQARSGSHSLRALLHMRLRPR